MIGYGRQYIDDHDIKAVCDVLNSTNLTQGAEIECFENAICDYTGAKYAVVVSSGTAALHLAAASISNEFDRLICPAISFVASANLSQYLGKDIIFADVSPNTPHINLDHVDHLALNSDIRNLVVVNHMAGIPCDMERLSRMAKKVGLAIIEDAAHALGASYVGGGKVGNCAYSKLTVFSFHPVKSITTGEGGCITTNDERLYRRLIRLRSHGITKLNDDFLDRDESVTNGRSNQWYYEMQELGFNYRLTDIQSALGRSQLKKLDSFIEWRQDIADHYDNEFDRAGIDRWVDHAKSSAKHLYILKIEFDQNKMTRRDLIDSLKADGVGTQVHYMPINMHPYYVSKGFDVNDTPNALKYYRTCLSIPIFYKLEPDQQLTVIRSIRRRMNFE